MKNHLFFCIGLMAIYTLISACKEDPEPIDSELHWFEEASLSWTGYDRGFACDWTGVYVALKIAKGKHYI